MKPTLRQRNLAAIGLAVALIIAGCSGSQGQDAGQGPGGNANPQNAGDYTYNPPDGLKQQDQQKNGNTVFLGTKEDGFIPTLWVKSGQKSDLKAEQYGKNQLAKITAEPGVTIKEQEPFQIPGSDAYTWMVEKKGRNGLVADQRQFVVAKNGIVVQFTLTTSATTMSKWDQALADSLQSFKWGR